MSDPLRPQPVRTEGDGTDKMQSRIIDGSIDAQVMEVDADKNAHVEVHGNKASDDSDVPLKLSETGRVNPDGVYHATDNSKPAHVGLVVRSQNASPADSQQTLPVTGKQSASDGTRSVHVIPRPENGEANTISNPFYVSEVENPGTEVYDHNDNGGVDVAASATVHHDYTVTALKRFVGDEVSGSSSGKGKFELKVETGVGTGVYTTKEVKFTTGSNPNLTFSALKRLVVAAGVKIRVSKTNLEATPPTAMAMYSTIKGVENTP